MIFFIFQLQLGSLPGGGDVISVIEGFLSDALIQIVYNKLEGGVASVIEHTVISDFNSKFTALTLKDIIEYLNKF